MDITTYSQDLFFHHGIKILIDAIPAAGIRCGGNIAIIDLRYPGDLSELAHKSICHAVFIATSPQVFTLLDDFSLGFDVYYMSANISLEEFSLQMGALLKSIMQQKCYQVEMRYPLSAIVPNDFKLKNREKQVLRLYKKQIPVLEIAERVNIHTTTAYHYKQSALRKLKIDNKATFVKLLTQANKIHDLYILQEYKKLNYSVPVMKHCLATAGSTLAG